MSEETEVHQIDTKIDNIFIDDNELCGKDELTDENKAFIKTPLDKANYKNILDDIKDDQQKLIQDDLSIPIPTGDIKTEIIDDVVPPVLLFFPTENEIFEIDDIIPSTAPLLTSKTEFIPNLTPPQKTGNKSVDDKNYEDYLKILQIYRPDLFIDEEDNNNYNNNNNNYVILTPKIEIIDDVVPPDIFTPKAEFVPDLTPPQKTGVKSVDDKNYEDYLKVLQIYRPDLFIDEEDNYVISTPKTEIIEIEDVVPPTPAKPIPVIPQENVKLPKPIPKTDLLENIDYISAISDINKITHPNQFDNVDGDIDFNTVEQTPDDDDDVTYVRYIPPPPEVPVPPPIHPRERLKQKMKRIRMKKERYRKSAEKKAINFLNKKNAAELLKEHREKQKANKKANKKTKPLLGVEDRLKMTQKAIEKLKDKDNPKRIREFVNSKKSKIYRQNTRKKAIKILNKKRKLKTVVESDDAQDNLLDTKTIPYAEPYRDTSKKDKIYRRNAKKMP